MIPTFNPGKYFIDAVNSVLKQDQGEDNMQIEVVDDCSTKLDVKKIVEENWKGRVKYHKLPKNVGHSFNFTECIRRSKGELVHILHDDDMVKDGFYPKIKNIFNDFNEIGAAFCRQEYIDENNDLKFHSDLELDESGMLDDALLKLAQKQRIQYCSMVVKRTVYEKVGGFIAKNIGCEDWEMWVRIAAFFPIGYIPEALAQYRVHHGTSMTLKDMRSGQDMRFMREAINVFNEYLPEEKREDVDFYRRKYYGDYSFKNAKRLLEEFNDKKGAAAQLSETIKIDSELIFNNANYLTNIEEPIESAGVSVILYCNNDSEVLERTIRHLIIQKVPKYIPWEIIITDNASTDDSLNVIKRTWKNYKGKTALKILRPEGNNILENRNTAIENAKYNFIIFCNPGDLLNRNYVHMVSINMMRDKKLGILGGYTESLTGKNTPDWFNDWSHFCYQTGEQYEYTSVITWTRGFVWGTGMAIRKEAWKSLSEKNFRSSFPDLKENVEKFSIDTELCYALRIAGWTIWYSMDLKMRHMFTDSELSWNHLRGFWKQYGYNFIKLYDLVNVGEDEHKLEDFGKLSKKLNRRKLVTEVYLELKGFKQWRLLSYKQSLTGDSDILRIEYKFAKLRELLRPVNTYNKKLRLLRRTFRKKDLHYLKYVIDKPYFRFPQYKRNSDKRGISVILNYSNSSLALLKKSLENISLQILSENFPWEVYIICNSLTIEFKNKLYRNWERSKCSASLKIIEENEINALTVKRIASSLWRFDFLLFLTEFDLINQDYLRIAFKTIHQNKSIGIAGGQTELYSDVKPPKWFENYKELFGIGKRYEESGDITYLNKGLWDSVFIVRKEAFLSTESLNFESDNYNTLKKNNRIPYLTDLSDKIKFAGWNVYYENRLKSKRIVKVNEFNWENLRNLFFLKGKLQVHDNFLKGIYSEDGKQPQNKSWILNAKDTLLDLNKFPYRKIFSYNNEYKEDKDVLEIDRLRGKLNEIISIKNKYENGSDNLKSRVSENGNFTNHKSQLKLKEIKPGVSIVICCYNSSELLPVTLRHIINQKVPDDIPWEIIIVDNASTDNTSEIAKNIWENHNCLAPFKIVKESEPGLSAARLKGFNTAKYDFIVLCDDDNWLHEDYVKNVYDIMLSNSLIGVLGGQSKAEFNVLKPKWFDDWKDSYAIGTQDSNDGDLTFTRGYVWGASMCVRKKAWDHLSSTGFKSKLTDRKGNTLSSGGDTEICFALRNEGWKIWYDHRLKFKHFISEKRLNWNYLKKLFRGFGQASPGLDRYAIINPNKLKKNKPVSEIYSVRKELHKTFSILRKTRYKKLLSYNKDRAGDSDIPMIEYCLGRIEGLLKLRGTYNRGLKTLKRSVRKKDHKYLKTVFAKYYKNYPRYKTVKKLNGVSVIVCSYNGEDRLADTVRHIAKQKTDKRLLWELILVDNASTDNTKQISIDEWKKHNVNANLIIVDEYTQGLSAARQKGFDTAKYEYIVLCDDDNWLDENFVQTAYDIMSSNDKIGILGGPNEALCELEPPEWFKWFQQGYAAGNQADLVTGKVLEGNITWKRGFVWGAGMIIRKSALKDLYSGGFTSLMSDRKGAQLSSGGDSELCFALVLSGWQVWYDNRLKLIHCMPAGRVSWDYLIRLFQGFGITSVGLDYYEKAIKASRADSDPDDIKKLNWKYEYRKSLKEVKKYGIKKLLSLRFPQDNKADVPMLEYHISRLNELKKVKHEYDDNLKKVLNSSWRLNPKELKSDHRKFIEIENDFRYGWPWGNEPVKEYISLKQYPKISILSPSFNSVNTIEKAVLSVLKQGYPNFEHIIYDGGSTDGTIEILKKYPHLIWVSEPDKGQCDAMNKAFDKSSGDIIAYLNTDDYFQRGAFVKIAKAFEENPEAEMVVGNLYFENDDHTFIRKPEVEYKKIMLPFKFIFPINPVSYFYKRVIQEKAGPFPLDNHYTMDYWFLLIAYQNHKIIKIEDYLGTFWMNGLNKTSGADNKTNTHHRVLEHCLKYDRKNLPYYLFNYYKFFYYEKTPLNLQKIRYKLRRNTSRIVSLITFRKNKYYSEKLFQSARSDYYLKKRFRSVATLLTSFMIYPKGLKHKSKQSQFVYSLLGSRYSEKAKLAYFFFTTPPGLPLGNKLNYYANEFRNNNKTLKGNALLLLTFIVSPKFIFKGQERQKPAEDVTGFRKFLRYLNPFYWLKKPVNFFRYNRYSEMSYNLVEKAGFKHYHHNNIQAAFLMLMSFLVYPNSLKQKSRLNLFTYSAFGTKMTNSLRFYYHLYKDNPEYTLAHKLNYYGNQLRNSKSSFKGSLIRYISYILSPKYFFNRQKREKVKKSNIVFVTEFMEEKKTYSVNPKVWVKNSANILKKSGYKAGSAGKKIQHLPGIVAYKFKSVYYYFRYRKFKEQSKNYYARAIENYNNDKRLETITALIPSYLLYPVSIFNRNKLSLIKNSITGSKNKKSGKNK